MKNHKLLLPLITFLFFHYVVVNGQINADFEMDHPSGCSPLIVTFTNLSSGPDSESYSYKWYFGEGMGTSTEKNPTTTYITQKVYYVSLVATYGALKDSITKQVLVYKDPVANFTAVQKGCAPYTVQFNNLSVPGDGAISGYDWDFGLGYQIHTEDPEITFPNEGKYNVTLVITDVHGCDAYKSMQDYIDVVNPPVTNFSLSPSSACTTPATFSFSNLSTGKGVLTYSWNFGNSVTSTLKNPPSQTYNNFGNYTISLTTTTDYGCSSSLSKIAYISAVNAAGELKQNGVVIHSGDTICAGVVSYKNNSTGAGAVRWLFGDGQYAVNDSGVHNYSESGSKTILLIAAPGTSCADTVSWKVYVERPLANFTLSPVYSCQMSVPVTFTNQSVGDVSWTWTFPDGQKAYTRNTSHTITLPGSADPYADNLLYTSLTIESPHGCKSTSTKSIRIKKPQAQFSVSVDSGCYPLQVTFTDQSISEESITTRKWVFDDGQTFSGSQATVNHSYITDGNFSPYLIITNSLGCVDTSEAVPVKTGKKLFPDFTVSNSMVCPHEILQFTNTTPESQLIEKWFYSYEDSLITTDPENPDLLWSVIPDTGYQDVKLEVMYNGCSSDTVKENIFFNKGPVARFAYTPDCSSPLDYTFENTSIGNSSFLWKLGNITNSTDDILSHSYVNEGDSLAELIAINGGCSDTTEAVVNIRLVNAVISTDTLLCALRNEYLKGNLSFSMPNSTPGKYSWYLCDTLLVTDYDSIPFVFQNRGVENIKLVTKFDNGCRDSADINVRVFKPYADFSADTLYGCSGLQVNFFDETAPDVHPLILWKWFFEAGSEIFSAEKIDTVSHIFNSAKTYPVSLEVSDNFGCKASFIQEVSTGNPNADFMVLNSGSCVGKEMQFIPLYQTQPVDSVIWDFGDGEPGKVTNSAPVMHTYEDTGHFNVSVMIYNFGCSDQSDTTSITVQKASAFFTASDTAWNCYPKLITFNHDPEGQIIESGVWDLGYGNSTINYTEESSIYYPFPGVYHPSLIVQTSFGCTDTFSRSIVITGPTGTFEISDPEICRGESITFTLTGTQDAVDYEWDLGDGSPFVSDSIVTHTYNEVGAFYPKLIVYGDILGNCKPAIADTINVFRVVAGFDVPGSGLCAGYPITLTNTSEGNDENHWNFNNSQTSPDQDLQLELDEGDYFAELIIQDDHGCSDTINKSFSVYPLPHLRIAGDTVLCEGTAINLWAEGGDEIRWSPSTGLSSAVSYQPQVSTDTSVMYTAVVTETISGCKKSDSVFVYVQLQPEITVIPNSDEIVIGDSVHISADSIGGLIYTWSPDYMIDCNHCASPWVKPLVNTAYQLVVSDTNHCFTMSYSSNFIVNESYKVRLPSAFTPGSTDENSILKVRGHGIKRLIEFSIYNRWGNRVFYTDDLQVGWDGKYKGKLQGIDSYAYVIVAEMWDGTVQTSKGTVSLIR